MKEKTSEHEEAQKTKPIKERTLLEKYDIPVEQLDFTYIKDCTDVKKVERILKVLRCGEEGYFPDLEKCVVTRLEELDPKNRNLRVQVPILRSDCMAKDELEELKKDFLGWVDKIEDKKDGPRYTNQEMSKEIFKQDFELPDIPIRGSDKEMKSVENEIKLTKETERIKSWEYDKWDKFDVDTELTKLDIEAMQCEEWDKSLDKKKLIEEQELVAKLMKNEDFHSKDTKKKTIFSNVKQSKTQSPTCSKITEINDDGVPDLEDDENLTALLHSRENSTPKINAKSNNSVTCSTAKPSTSTQSNDALQLQNLLTSCTKRASDKPTRSTTGASSQFCRDPERKSFIEEIPMEKPKEEKPKRRFKIQIDDINIG